MGICLAYRHCLTQLLLLLLRCSCREIWVRRPHEFKIACLQDIRALFPPEWNPFYAGFGNRDTDEVSYRCAPDDDATQQLTRLPHTVRRASLVSPPFTAQLAASCVVT
jgi:hypothetical protein